MALAPRAAPLDGRSAGPHRRDRSLVAARRALSPAASATSWKSRLTTAAELCRADCLRENIVVSGPGFDPAELRRVSLTRVLADETHAFLEKAEGGPKGVAKALGRYDPKRRGLLALTAMLIGWHHHYEPARLFRHIFCGGWGNVAPEMVEALADAGAAKQEAAMRSAVAAFDDRSRRDSFRRSERFGRYWDPPNALARSMVDLGEAFGTREAFVAVVADYACADPALVAWVADLRGNLTDDDCLGWLIDTLVQRFDTGGDAGAVRARLAAIPNPYRALYLAARAEAEIYNGGVSQYFTNSSGKFAPMAVEALEAIGLPKQAAVIAKGVALFPDPFPDDPGAYAARAPGKAGEATEGPGAEDRRWSREFEKKLNRLTKSWGEWETVRAAIAAYARREGAIPD